MQVLKRLFRFLLPYGWTLVVSAFLLLARAGVELVPPLFQRNIVDGVIGHRDLTQLLPLVGMMVGLYAILGGIHFGDNYVRHTLGQRFILDLRVRIYAYLQRLSLSFFERTSTGELMSRVTNDVNALEQFVTHGSALTAVNLLRVVGAAVILFVLDWRLTLWVLIPIPILAVSLRIFNTRVRPIYRRVRDRLGDINARLQDSLAGIRVIQAFGQEDRELEHFAEESDNYYQEQVKGIRYWSAFFPAMNFVATIGTVIVLGAGAAMVVRGSLTLGTLVAFLAYLQSLYGPINSLVEIDNMLQQAVAAGERIFELLDQVPEIADSPGAVELPPITGEVVFHDVHFAYNATDESSADLSALGAGTAKGREVLQDLSFHMSPGEVVALVGPSGAGKTSIANLLCRFYDPISGQITVDGHDLRQVTTASLRSQIAVVLQDTFLFNCSIRENLAYGNPGASDEDIISAAKAAYAHDFIAAMPRGYDTDIGERGVRLSGGQKQRLALARAILTDPRILILDEATSSVDAEAEYLIQQALEAVLEGRTALVIAHRLSTIRNAQKIIALEDGRIIEVGDHEALMQRNGLYSQLYRRQLTLAAT